MARYRGIGINPRKFDRTQIKFYLMVLPLASIMILPILFISFHAFKPIDELFAFPPIFITRRPTFLNFSNLLYAAGTSGVPMLRYLFNSILSTAAVVFFSVWISSAAGYVLSKKRFRGREVIFTLNTLALMFVPIAVSIPRYLTIVGLGLIDNFSAHILPMLAMPVGLFLVKQFIDIIPDSLIEAAQIDGASDYYILSGLIIPMIKPALSTVAILAFQSSWNSTEASAMFINDESLKTFAFYMNALVSGVGNVVAGQGLAAAASLVMFVPNLILFIFLQARVMNTMAHSGIK